MYGSSSLPFLDPLAFAKMAWPKVTFYRQQIEIIYSVIDNDETYVPAGNALGKDFVAAFIAIWWFISRRPARVVTTSVKIPQLEDVLWGEIRRFLRLSEIKLPIQYNHLKIRRLNDDGTLFPNGELVGQVSNTQEGLLGRHATEGFTPPNTEGGVDIPRTLVIFDEASGIDDQTYDSTQTWAHRKLIIGNPFPCENFFKRGVKEGDRPRPDRKVTHPTSKKTYFIPNGYYRKVIKIRAIENPNIQYALKQISLGIEPTDTILIPGVKSYGKYLQDRELWDPILQCIGLDAEFYEGRENLLYPPQWLNESAEVALKLRLSKRVRKAEAIGIDPAEGGDKTCMTAIDRYGIIEQVARKTPNTSDIDDEAIDFIKKHGLANNCEKVAIDRGGGGKQCADHLAKRGYPIVTVPFGEALTPDPVGWRKRTSVKLDEKEERYVYKNRRAKMYGTLSECLDPSLPFSSEGVFAIPGELHELRRQLAPIPKTWDPEGRLYIIPKDKPAESDSEKRTLRQMLGCSPDEADSLVLALHALTYDSKVPVAGAVR